MGALRILGLGARAVVLRPRLALATWTLHLALAVLAVGPPAAVFSRVLAHRPEASRLLLDGFSLELLVDAQNQLSQGISGHALLLVVLLYAAVTLALEALWFSACLWPFERGPAFTRVLGGVLDVTWKALLFWGLLLTLAPASGGRLLPLVVLAAAGFRVLVNLWKCASITGAGGVGAAWQAARRRPWAAAALAVLPVAGLGVYALAAAVVFLFSLNSSNVVLGIVLQQVLLAAAIAFRLWLLASCTVLWRSQI